MQVNGQLLHLPAALPPPPPHEWIKVRLFVSVRRYIQKFPDIIDNEIHAYNNKHSLRSNTKAYGGNTHLTDSRNSDTTASRGIKLYHLQFSLQTASPDTFGYTLVHSGTGKG
jgi:hypothetical protein